MTDWPMVAIIRNDFQSSKNDVINEEIFPDNEKSRKWRPKPITALINKLPLFWKIVINMASGVLWGSRQKMS